MEFLTKHKRNQKTNKKLAEKGITLIALVITVIVLLILAGVSISAITGNESAMEKAKQAKTANENADELDTIKLAIVESVAAGYTGEIDGNVLAQKLTGIATVEPQTTNGKITSYKITGLKSHIVYEVQPNGSIEAKSGISLDKSKIIFTPSGDTTNTLTATLSEDLSGTINWSTSDANVASISSTTGNTITVTKVGSSGSTTITASLPGTSYTATCIVKIVETVASVTVSPSTLTVGVGETSTTKLSAIAKGSSGNETDATITYTVTPEGAVTVNNATGEVTGGDSEATNVIIKAVATQGSTSVESTTTCTVTVEENLELISSKKGTGILNETKNTKLKDAKGNKIIVPAGFGISSDNGAAANVEEGIIIQDASGNQFVWIPVGTITKSNGTPVTINMSRREFANDGTATERAANYTISSYYTETTSNTKARKNESGKIEAVEQATAKGGFYIGRYEAGQGNVCKANQPVYNNVYRGGVTNYSGALEQAQGMYTGKETLFKSDLVNSYAWDTAIYFIQQCGTNSKYSQQIGLSKTNTSSPQNTGTNLLAKDKDGNNLTTGVIDVQCNIYDMAGNVYEWTTEGTPYVYRGGIYAGTGVFTASRIGITTSSSYLGVGFRSLLYIM